MINTGIKWYDTVQQNITYYDEIFYINLALCENVPFRLGLGAGLALTHFVQIISYKLTEFNLH